MGRNRVRGFPPGTQHPRTLALSGQNPPTWVTEKKHNFISLWFGGWDAQGQGPAGPAGQGCWVQEAFFCLVLSAVWNWDTRPRPCVQGQYSALSSCSRTWLYPGPRPHSLGIKHWETLDCSHKLSHQGAPRAPGQAHPHPIQSHSVV